MNEEIASLTAADWHTLTPERYRELFAGSAIDRAGYDGVTRNIVAGKDGQEWKCVKIQTPIIYILLVILSLAKIS